MPHAWTMPACAAWASQRAGPQILCVTAWSATGDPWGPLLFPPPLQPVLHGGPIFGKLTAARSGSCAWPLMACAALGFSRV